MRNGGRFLALLVLASSLLAQPLAAQTVTNVRATQLPDKTVEVLYDLSGAASGGATATVSFSSDGGGTYGISPSAGALSGQVGSGVASGSSRRIVLNAAASLPAQTYGTDHRATVTATNASSGEQEITVTLPGGVPLVMVRIPAGTFQMGAPASERNSSSNEQPVHQVTLTQDYFIGKYEVTQAQWQAVMGTNPSYFSSCGGNCPVEQVSWDDIRGANGFIARLNQLMGTTEFRLPTEAEWERAARAGTQTRFSFGDALDGDDVCGANAAADPYVWWCANSGRTKAVGMKKANPYGLFDVHGNVWEWVEDWYGSYPSTAQTNPTGPATGSYRVFRGGGWYNYGSLRDARSANRYYINPDYRGNFLGFRLARSNDLPTTPTMNPVLFAHGICSDCSTWDDMTANLQREAPERYGSQPRIDLYFDGTWVRNRNDDNQYYPARSGFAQIPEGNLYAITYYDTSAGNKTLGFNKLRVAQIPIEQLAGQLAAVAAAIRSINGIGAIDVVSHSMGGLVTRALVEGLSSPGSQLEAFVPGSIRQIVTIDTPHSGYPHYFLEAAKEALTKLLGGFPLDALSRECFLMSSTHKDQMIELPRSPFLTSLNSRDIPSSIALTAIATTGRAFLIPYAASDGIVTTASQDLKAVEKYRCAPHIATIPNRLDSLLAHVDVLRPSETARLVDSILARTKFGGAVGGCQAFSPSIPATLSVPDLTESEAGTRTVVLSFPADSPAQGAVAGLTSSSCWATVVARADDGRELARQEVPAVGTQIVQFGVLPASGWRLELVSSCATTVFAKVEFTPVSSFGSAMSESVVPIVLDVRSGSAHYTTELSLVNRGTKWALATLSYTPSLGTREGAGILFEKLAPGTQKSVPDVLAFLRDRGLRIPPATSGQQGGTLFVSFGGAETEESVSVSVRTTTATQAPQPQGSAGLAYAGTAPAAAREGSLAIYGLRDNAQDRSNVAVFNPTPEPVTVRMTAFGGDSTGYSSVVRDGLNLPAFGWIQVSNVFSGTGISSGWVSVQRTSSSGRFGAYGVINDNATNDGSFVLPTAGTVSGSKLTVPVLVETSAFRSELVLANRGSSTATLTLRYVERLTPALGSGGTATVQLRPREQLVIPDAIQYLRNRGIALGAMGAGSYAGALRVSVSGVGLSEIFAGARTASPSPAGGQFGLFTPGVYESETAGAEAYVFGLRADATSRSNVAIVNAGGDADGGVTLEVQVYDGDRGGAAAGSPRVISLAPGQWEQITGILGGVAVQNGWVRVRRTAGTAGWIAYGVVNDGGQPGQRTGDGAYVPMTTKAGSAPPPPPTEPNEITYTLPGGVPLVMVRIPAGTFQMGSPTSEVGRYDSETSHEVRITRDYWIAKFETTQEQWQAVMGTQAPCAEYGSGRLFPWYCASWFSITHSDGFLVRLNRHLRDTGQTATGDCRLPTDAEWERAARGGNQFRYSFGDDPECQTECGSCTVGNRYMWTCSNAERQAHEVGRKLPNPYGLFDMHGNVWEWVQDWWTDLPTSAATDPTGPTTGTYRVFRGGGFLWRNNDSRSASRNSFFPESWGAGGATGFRVAASSR